MTTVQPLLTLSKARIEEEMWSAELMAAAAAAYGRKTARLVRICTVAGLTVLGFSLWIASSALAQVVFYAGVLWALCGPMWTGLLSPWLEDRR